MKNLKWFVALLTLAGISNVNAQSFSTNTLGNTTYYSNGGYSNNIGSTTYYNNVGGSINGYSTQIGNTRYFNIH